MELRAESVSTIQRAWARILGVQESAMPQGGSRIHRETAEHSVLMFVSLFGQGILIGPGWAIEEANGMTDVELASHERLLEMNCPHGGRALGEASPYFSDTTPSVPHGAWEVRRDHESAEVLEATGAPGGSC